MKTPKKRILYSNYNLDELAGDATEWLIEQHLEEFPNENNWTPSDQQVWDEIQFMDSCSWDDFEMNFKDFFDSNTFILQGTIGTWHGQCRGGFVFDSFREMSQAWENCDYVEIYDENGHLYIRCSHHDGNNHFEIRMLNEKGRDYVDNHYYDYGEKVHNKVMKNPYSVLPNCAHKIYGCKRVEYENI